MICQVPGGLFHQPWWLDAVAPGRWASAEVKDGDVLRARLPYVLQKRCGFTFITRPPLTPALGPWLEPSTAKQSRDLRRQKDLIESLLIQLPPATRTTIYCQPRTLNMMPFHWAGFHLSVRFTYILPDLSNMDSVWGGFDSNIRSDIRKAEKILEIRDDLPMESFVNVYEKTFRRQHLQLPLQRDFYSDLDRVLASHGRRRAFFAVDSKEQIHAVAYLVWDDQRAYYLMGGADPALRSSGASSLLLWNAIQFSATVSQSFDFEGSMLEAVERFFRAFGGIQAPYYVATRMANRFATIGSILLRGAA